MLCSLAFCTVCWWHPAPPAAHSAEQLRSEQDALGVGVPGGELIVSSDNPDQPHSRKSRESQMLELLGHEILFQVKDKAWPIGGI